MNDSTIDVIVLTLCISIGTVCFILGKQSSGVEIGQSVYCASYSKTSGECTNYSIRKSTDD